MREFLKEYEPLVVLAGGVALAVLALLLFVLVAGCASPRRTAAEVEAMAHHDAIVAEECRKHGGPACLTVEEADHRPSAASR